LPRSARDRCRNRFRKKSQPIILILMNKHVDLSIICPGRFAKDNELFSKPFH
jgi:hypothetical protein